MKRYISFIAVGLLIMFVLVVPTHASASFDVSLKYGSRGAAVVELQDFLTDQGNYTGKIDGRFGFATLRAVQAFQLKNNLTVDGYFGKASRTTANNILTVILEPSNTTEQAETGVISVPIVQPITPPINPPVVAQAPTQTPPPAPVATAKIKVLETVTTANGSMVFDGADSNITATQGGHITFGVKVYNTANQEVDTQVQITTNEPELPPVFGIKTNKDFYVGTHDGKIPESDCSQDDHDCIVKVPGTYSYTFSSTEFNVSKTIQVVVK